MRDPAARLRAVLFDWDGTLVDSADASYRCYERLFGEYGIAFDRARFERTYSPNWHRTYEALGLGRECWVDGVTCGDDTRRRKPDPEPLRLGLSRLGVAAPAAAYVGDSPEDVEMARAAEVYAVGVPGGFPNRAALAASAPDLLAPDLSAAADALLAAAVPEAARRG